MFLLSYISILEDELISENNSTPPCKRSLAKSGEESDVTKTKCSEYNTMDWTSLQQGIKNSKSLFIIHF